MTAPLFRDAEARGDWTRVTLAPGGDLDGFRRAARRLCAAETPPDTVLWDEGGGDTLLEMADRPGGAAEETTGAAPLLLTEAAGAAIASLVRHADPERYSLLYRLIWRLTHGERALMQIASDPLIRRLHGMEKSLRRDVHKMHAFVRFRAVPTDAGEAFMAWFEPDHWIVPSVGAFFVDRFRGMDWTILTPRGSLHWDLNALRLGPAASRADAPGADDAEAYWLGYYESIFNPARLNPTVMRGHMAVKYWKNLPEAAAIGGLIREAPRRVEAMIAAAAAAPLKRNPDKALAAMTNPTPETLEALNQLILQNEAPPPFSPRAVLGEGPQGARIALVGEQPGDEEDVAGRPFIGPAGRLLDQALAQAGIDRKAAYVTNAVKNFKFKAVGKRRLHQTPTTGEIKRYRWWLEQELDLVKPHLVVALGATATQALAGKAMPVMKNRGPTDQFAGRSGFVTVHPSSLLRQPDEAARAEAFDLFVRDLKQAAALAA